VSVPLILYNFPRHAGVVFTREVLAQIEHFGMKDSSADLSLIDATPRYFIGGDPEIVTSARKGASGFVSGVANAAPDVYVELEGAIADRDWGRAEQLQEKVRRLVEPLRRSCAIATIKRRLAEQLVAYPARMRTPLVESE
jgi:dihydrodipicolinate synthase/N-acetylneuraminate lyase